jgi:hypothetical protein
LNCVAAKLSHHMCFLSFSSTNYFSQLFFTYNDTQHPSTLSSPSKWDVRGFWGVRDPMEVPGGLGSRITMR